MTKNTRFKYIIPLALCALLVVAAMPAHAVTSHKLNDANSIVEDNFAVQWEGTPTTENVDIDSGDILYWDSKWTHSDDNYRDYYYIGTQLFGLTRADIDHGVYLSPGGYHERTTSTQVWLDSDPQKNFLSRIHAYSKDSDVFGWIFGRTSGIIAWLG